MHGVSLRAVGMHEIAWTYTCPPESRLHFNSHPLLASPLNRISPRPWCGDPTFSSHCVGSRPSSPSTPAMVWRASSGPVAPPRSTGGSTHGTLTCLKAPGCSDLPLPGTASFSGRRDQRGQKDDHLHDGHPGQSTQSPLACMPFSLQTDLWIGRCVKCLVCELCSMPPRLSSGSNPPNIRRMLKTCCLWLRMQTTPSLPFHYLPVSILLYIG